MPPWTFPTDQPARRAYFTPEVFSHPAKLHLGLLQRLIDMYTVPGNTLFDPMAGTGSLMIAATQQRNVVLRELQPEYIELMRRSEMIVRRRSGLLAGQIDIAAGDARTWYELPTVDHAIFSPPYGFETGRGISNRRRLQLLDDANFGRRWLRYLNNPTHASIAAGFRYEGGQNNTGNKSGRNYWRDMKSIYQNVASSLTAGGLMILILKNHYRRGNLIDVTNGTIKVCKEWGLELAAQHGRLVRPLSLWQRRRKEQGLPVVEIEDVLVFQKN